MTLQLLLQWVVLALCVLGIAIFTLSSDEFHDGVDKPSRSMKAFWAILEIVMLYGAGAFDMILS